ncbi:endonuclease [Antarctobacter heliothermus]|uniref:Endonuclease n=1 Tax=Antarctobacter heliothermus TaxID=74033 RepID=A0A222E130_9RHOB|nr:endonuclease/exonuclease/phosphatase family protein [Antarctobacter heliothermus]ASP19896.1 endonuclease [Antarctobacter heliothermus]
MLADFDKVVPDLSPIMSTEPDVLVLTDIDYDAGLVTLSKLRDVLQEAGLDYPHQLSVRPNTGMPTDLDIDGDGRRGGPRDAQGFGWFSGQGGMAVLSRFPVDLLADHSKVLWKDTHDSTIAKDDPAFAIQRLSSSTFWAVRVAAPDGDLTLLTLGATPPVFDGPDDRNGRRNRDEVLFWAHVLNGDHGPIPEGPVAVIGNLNLDPERGNGLHEAARTLLTHPRLQDPMPGVQTVAWDSTGPMRVSYVLPDRSVTVGENGVTPPSPDLGRHGLVWVDLALR